MTSRELRESERWMHLAVLAEGLDRQTFGLFRLVQALPRFGVGLSNVSGLMVEKVHVS